MTTTLDRCWDSHRNICWNRGSGTKQIDKYQHKRYLRQVQRDCRCIQQRQVHIFAERAFKI